MTKKIHELKLENERLAKRDALFVEVLERMVNPIGYFINEAAKENRVLVPHMAMALRDSAGFYQEEAREALATAKRELSQ